ncbi:two-component system C4-dicarboxylate transport response regulator DctD [Chitinivorax tropicus]|uniref:Two-component system C4-dicarboxylate transport response regulator DctD n=1 Tax=Chitinivorax tropicus TaxID=714531 RepID=A0A840MIK7_9PROT|nr:sigma-54 dependent transcriptional regulator [Chitinivorax tropicus]MBB5019044.1 two-component system C4-dicarboxylate transport response regulator DctD [Chitinivorax tropicus]
MIEALQVLIVEDDPVVRLGCVQAFALEGIAAIEAGSAEAALQQITPGFPGVVVTDIRLPGQDGMALLNTLRAQAPDLPVIMITGHGDVSLAVQAMKQGAYDFLEKPFAPEQLVEVTRRALAQRQLSLEVASLRAQLASHDHVANQIIGHSPAMARLRRLIAEVANTGANVLIHGETGTGKELVARCLHESSQRHTRHFVAVNCGGLPEQLIDSELFGHEAGAFTGAAKRRIGKIEHAQGGTLFLDEIESMPMPMQIKLLRVLQERVLERLGSNALLPVDIRVVAATKSDLKRMGEAGHFRSDLYYRLNVVTLELPPLRERREDIPQLFQHFLLQAAQRFERDPPVLQQADMARLMAYNWPGNVRELRNVAERCALGLGLAIGTSDEPMEHTSLNQAVEQFEKALIRDALHRCGGNLSKAAEALSVAKTTLFDKVKKYRLS